MRDRRLSFWVQGSVGHETPNLYLTSGEGSSYVRQWVPLARYIDVSTNGTRLEIPTEDFVGVDLSAVRTFELIWEWGSAGTVWIDGLEIR